MRKLLLSVILIFSFFSCQNSSDLPISLKKDNIEIGSPVRFKNLTIIPVRSTSKQAKTEYFTLDEAIEKQLIDIEEHENESVNSIKITNKSDKNIFIMGGEIITGCKQDRIIGSDIILKPNEEIPDVTVFCVENGRWTYESDNFYSKENLGTYKLRSTAQTNKSYSQSKIWNEISVIEDNMSKQSETAAYQDLYEDEELEKMITEYQEDIGKILSKEKNNSGVFIAVNEKIISVDIFTSSDLFQKLWPKILKSSILTAINEEKAVAFKPVTSKHAKKFFEEMKKAAADSDNKEAEINVNESFFKNRSLHISAFPADDEAFEESQYYIDTQNVINQDIQFQQNVPQIQEMGQQ